LSAGVAPITVSDDQDLQAMASYLLSGDRDQPAIALTSGSTGQLVLAPDKVREIVGGAQIYLVTGEDLLLHFEGLLGPNLALPSGAVRIWWPELTVESDPLEHPAVLQLEDEPEADTLGEFARCFELSRPTVRREITLIEDARRLVECELEEAREQQRRTDERLRDTQVECHEQETRTEEAEARLEDTRRELDALRSSIGGAPEKGTGLDAGHE
jgi:hypothetical protein